MDYKAKIKDVVAKHGLEDGSEVLVGLLETVS